MKTINVVVLFREKSEAAQLLKKCSDELLQSDVNIKAEFITCAQQLCESTAADCVVVPLDKVRDVSGVNVRKLSYAVDNSGADVAAINVQKRENGYSFEILYGSSMGRVFIRDGCEYTREQVLVSVAVICAAGVPVEKILKTINGLLK